jgi:hypothetical protein
MKQQEEKRKKEKVMIRLYAYTSEKKKVKTKKKIKKDISKYLAKLWNEKLIFIAPDYLALVIKRKYYKSKDFVLPYMDKREFKELLKEEDNLDSSLFCKFYIVEEPVTILHLSSLLDSETNFSNVRLYLDGKKVKLVKHKLNTISCKVAKHRLSFNKKDIKILKKSLDK